MATADAKLLPPPPFPVAPDSDQNLDSVGPLAVLGAMVEQRRASRPAPDELQGLIDQEQEEEDDGSADETRRVPMYSDAFLKVR